MQTYDNYKLQTYDKYKPSGVEWLGDIPEHWNVKRLKYVAKVQSSNVDKKSFADEIPVLLCNYVDVYKHEFIDDRFSFMEATATENEIKKFILNEKDVLITKDSETPSDIANPALITQDFDNVLCGYHLAQIKPSEVELDGGYLFRLFQSKRFNSYFEMSANGVTRFGLPLDSITGVFVSMPPISEQTAIAAYLDEKTAQLDKLMANKARLIELLKEERLGVINQAVTRGLNPHAKRKPSGLDWLGDIPEHWTQSKVGYISRIVRGASPRPAGDPELFDGDHTPWITVAEVTKDNTKFITAVSEYLTEAGAKRSRFVEIGTLLLSNSGATLGVPKILKIAGCINDGSVAFLDLSEKVSIDFLYYFFITHTEIYREQAKGSGQPNLNTDIVKSTDFVFPSVMEQATIVQFIETETGKIDATVATIEKEIELLKEYRTALISEVVTGKVKVV